MEVAPTSTPAEGTKDLFGGFGRFGVKKDDVPKTDEKKDGLFGSKTTDTTGTHINKAEVRALMTILQLPKIEGRKKPQLG